MKNQVLKEARPKFSVIGLGTFPFDEEVWGIISEDKAMRILLKAYEKGVTYFNSAYYYGKGRCEKILGKAIKKMDRDKITVATKVGTEFGEFSLSKKRINKSVESILKRMQLDYIDILILHMPDPKTPIEKSMEAMSEIKARGLIRYIGISNFPIDLASRVAKIAPITIFEFYFSMLTQKTGRKVLEFCRKHRIAATPFKVIERGILTDFFFSRRQDVLSINRKYNNPFTKEEHIAMTEKLVSKLQSLAKSKGISLAQLAISWVISQPGITTALVGVRALKHLEEDLKAAEVKLNREDIVEIDGVLNKYRKLDA